MASLMVELMDMISAAKMVALKGLRMAVWMDILTVELKVVY